MDRPFLDFFARFVNIFSALKPDADQLNDANQEDVVVPIDPEEWPSHDRAEPAGSIQSSPRHEAAADRTTGQEDDPKQRCVEYVVIRVMEQPGETCTASSCPLLMPSEEPLDHQTPLKGLHLCCRKIVDRTDSGEEDEATKFQMTLTLGLLTFSASSFIAVKSTIYKASGGVEAPGFCHGGMAAWYMSLQCSLCVVLLHTFRLPSPAIGRISMALNALGLCIAASGISFCIF